MFGVQLFICLSTIALATVDLFVYAPARPNGFHPGGPAIAGRRRVYLFFDFRFSLSENSFNKILNSERLCGIAVSQRFAEVTQSVTENYHINSTYHYSLITFHFSL